MAKQQMNDRKSAVTAFCLVMEEFRRTDAGRVRTSREMRDFFFPMSAATKNAPATATDRIFHYIPRDVRGPIIANWGIRGPKSAKTDNDEKVRDVVHDALIAADIDDGMFEDGLDARNLMDWVPLDDWWMFWRKGKLTGVAIQKALATGRELGLFDDRWFLDNLHGRGGKLQGTETISETLSKDEIVKWMRAVHTSGDGSPAGLVAALGWDVILAKTTQEALLYALDAFAKRISLVLSERVTTPPEVAIPDIPAADLELEDQSLWGNAPATP